MNWTFIAGSIFGTIVTLVGFFVGYAVAQMKNSE